MMPTIRRVAGRKVKISRAQRRGTKRRPCEADLALSYLDHIQHVRPPRQPDAALAGPARLAISSNARSSVEGDIQPPDTAQRLHRSDRFNAQGSELLSAVLDVAG